MKQRAAVDPVQGAAVDPVPGVAGLVLLAALGALATAIGGAFLDDAFIGFRYVQNLVEGRGFVFNPGESVEGVSNIGYLLLLAIPATGLEVPLAAKLLGVAGVLGLGFLLWRSRERFFSPDHAPGSVLAVIALTLLSFSYLYYSLAGMETPLMALLLLGYVLARREIHRLGLATWASLVHPEALVLYPAGLVLEVRSRGPRYAMRWLTLYLVIQGGIAGARQVQFERWLPNTYVAKSPRVTTVGQRLTAFLTGKVSNIPAPFHGLLFPLAFLVGLATMPDREVAGRILVVGGIGLAFAVYARDDWTGTGRYLGPYIPTLALGGRRGLEVVAGRLSRGRGGVRSLIVMTVTIGVLAHAAFDLLSRLEPSARTTYPAYVVFGESLIAPSVWMGRNLPADAVIATQRIGAVAFFSRRRVFDFRYGLTDRDVADRVATEGRWFFDPRHPALADVWNARAPTHILEDSHILPLLLDPAREGQPPTMTVHGSVYRVRGMFRIGVKGRWVLFER